MSFSEWSNKKKKRKEEDEQSAAVTPSAGSYPTTTTSKRNTTSFSDWSNKKTEKTSVKGWGNASKRFLDEVQQYYGSYHADDEETYRGFQDRASELLASADNWRNQYKDNDEAISYINSVVSALSDSKDYALKSRKYYSQFDSELSYNRYKNYGGKSYDEIKAILNGMGENAEDYEWLKEYAPSAVFNSEDFEHYSKLGKSVSNPSWKDSQTPWNIFGWKPFGEGEDIKNIVTFAEKYEEEAAIDALSTMNGGGYDSEHTELVTLINRYMKDDEKAIYNYFIGKGYFEQANEYMTQIADVLRQRAAGRIAEHIDKTAFELPASLVAGVEQFGTGVKNLGAFITGDEGLPTSVTQYAHEAMSGNNDGAWKVVNDLTYTTGNMLPSILVGSLTGGVGGAITQGVSAAGNAYAEMRNLGYDEWQSRGYGMLVGASEAGLSYALGGISKLGGKVSGNAISKLISKLDNAFARTAITLGGSMLSEGVEEAIQTVLEPAFKALMTGENFESPKWDEILYSGLLGALSAGVLEGGPTIANTVNENRYGKQIYGENQNELVAEGLESAEGSLSNTLAQKYQQQLEQGGDLNGIQLNRLADANEQQIVAEDISKIQNAVEERLTRLGETGDVKLIGAALTKQVTGEKLTRAETQAIKNSKYGQRVSNELNPENIKSGEYSSAWAERLDTNRINAEEYSRLATEAQVAQEEGEPDKGITSAPIQNVPQRKKIEPVNAPVEEAKPSESEIQPTEDTKTTVTVDGKKAGANVKGIASIEGGKVSLELENGEVVDAADARYEGSASLVYQAAAEMATRVGGFNVDTANTFIKGYDAKSGQSASEYITGWSAAYKFGTQNSPRSVLSVNPYTAKLTQAQRDSAYNFGKIFGNESVESNTSKIASIGGIKSEKIASTGAKTQKGRVHFDGSVSGKTLNEVQKSSLKALGVVADALGIDIHVFESSIGEDGRRQGANGWYDPKDNSIHIDLYSGVSGRDTMLFTAAHELTHFIRRNSPEKFNAFADFLFEEYGKKFTSEDSRTIEELIQTRIKRLKNNGRITPNMTEEEIYDLAYEEVVADFCEAMLVDSNAIETLARLKAKDESLFDKIKEFITKLINRIKEAYKGLNPDSAEGNYLREMIEAGEKLQEMWTEALSDAAESFGIVEIDTTTESVAPMFSERTWSESEYVIYKDQMAEKIAKALGVTKEKAESYIDDINSIAKIIADDRVRLDYEASSFGSAFVSNVEYGGSFDYTTLCKKRRIYTGTFTEIQKRLNDVALTPDEILTIRNLMIEEGIEATCGLCYVEGSRANMGKFAKEFIRLYKRDYPLAWIPNMADVNTPDGVEQMRISHPEAYEQYVYFWNHYGKLKDSDPALFASQQKPKLYEARKEYKGEILEQFKNDTTVEKKNRNGGIRMQSFSDFEIVHLIDTMQVIMDMSIVGLAGQAYTKVPEFAEAFGNTGLKINLSLIAKGVDADGNLVFDDREGMPHKTAFDLRKKYSKNVGTIIVTFTDEQLVAAMADTRIDFIIPFHRSQWKKGQYGAMGLPKGTKDYTFMQNEKLIKKTYHEYRGRMVLDKATNYMPNEYWDFSKSGKENAETYLKMCAENNKRPKFYKLLDYDGSGTYSLKADGSTDGYWKLLIDFKMYDNDGVGSPQMAVAPMFNMDEAKAMLNDYQGGHSKYPVASSVVDKFVESYNKEHGTRYSDRYLSAEENPDILSMTAKVESGNFKANEKVFFGIVPDTTAQQIQNLTGINVNGFKVAIEARQIEHILKDHGKQGMADKSMADPSHIAKMEYALNDPDDIRKAGKTQAYTHMVNGRNRTVDTVLYEKSIGAKSYYVVQAVPDTNAKTLYIVTAFIGKEGYKKEAPQLINAKSLDATAKTESVDTSVNMIPQDSNFVNEKFSDRSTDSFSNRSLLANALESAAQNGIERERLAEYKNNIDNLNKQEQILNGLKEEISQIYKSTGKRDMDRLNTLRAEAEKTAQRINIYDGQLLRLESTKALKNLLEREKAAAYKAAKAEGRELVGKYRTRAETREIREKIKKFKSRLENSLMKPTDRVYVPAGLISAMVDVCDLIDTDTDLYKKDGTINKAQERRNLTKERLIALEDQYAEIKSEGDEFGSEYEEAIQEYLTNLRKKFGDSSLKEMTLEELTDMYETLRSIEQTLRDARKLIGKTEAKTIYEAADSIVSEQNRIIKKHKDKPRSALQVKKDDMINLTLSPVRNVERMSGYNETSDMVDLFHDFEKGVRKKNMFSMEAYKAFERLTTGKNQKAYENAIYFEHGGKKYIDTRGKRFGITKMQMMQALLSYERELANNMNHIKVGGFNFADVDMLRKGDLKKAVSKEYDHKIMFSPELIEGFKRAVANDRWAQEYMSAARTFFNTTAKNAINETYLTLKHRIIAKDKNYIPFEVDKSFVVREINADESVQQTINSYGMLKSTKPGASQSIIISGLNSIIDRHIDLVGNVYGLAVPIRNFNKVWNAKSEVLSSEDITVKAIIGRAWGAEGVESIEQTVKDLQSPRISTQSSWYRKIKSNYIGATFMFNLSVVTKQIGSLYSATSMLRWRDPVRMMGNLFYTMVNHKKISAEVDKYTATAWMRRQGLSDAELNTLITEAKKTKIAKFFSKAPALINPAKWITAMDSVVALSLWRCAKQDVAKKTKLRGAELLKATAEYYDSVIENTQSMTDVLHRPEIQKRDDILSESLGMFKTDLYQMAGQLQLAAGRLAAKNNGKNRAAVAKTIYAILSSAVWGQLMTSLFALLRYKVDPYRDDETKDLTVWSWLKKQLFALAGDISGYILPLLGSEFMGVIENVVYGESDDPIESVALTAVNELINSIVMFAGNIKDGEMPSAKQWESVVVKSLQAFGVPSNNINRLVKAVSLHAEDVANGEFLSFEAGAERSAKNYVYGIIKEVGAGKRDAAEKRYIKGAMDKGESALKTALGKVYQEGDVSKQQTINILTMIFDIEADEATKTVNKWTCKIVTGISYDDIKENYLEGNITAARAAEMYVLYGGYSKEKAKEKVSKFEFYEDEGYEYDDRNKLFKDGELSATEYLDAAKTQGGKTDKEAKQDLVSTTKSAYKEGYFTRSEAVKTMVDYGGLSESDAEIKVRHVDLKKQYPSYEITEDQTETYVKKLESSGLSIPNYMEYIELKKDCDGEDKNGDGKADRNTKKAEIMEAIDSLPIPNSQKDALYYANDWAENRIHEAPWH